MVRWWEVVWIHQSVRCQCDPPCHTNGNATLPQSGTVFEGFFVTYQGCDNHESRFAVMFREDSN